MQEQSYQANELADADKWERRARIEQELAARTLVQTGLEVSWAHLNRDELEEAGIAEIIARLQHPGYVAPEAGLGVVSRPFRR